MRNIILILLFISSPVLMISQNNVNASVDTSTLSLQHTYSKQDTQQVQISVINNQAQSKPIWEYILPLGAVLLGSFLSALIAILSIGKTYKNLMKLEEFRTKISQKKEISEYCGTVYALYTCLQSNLRQIEQLKPNVESLRQFAELKHQFPFNDLGLRLWLDFFDRCLRDYLGHRQYGSKLGAFAIAYLHSANNFNEYLNFNQVVNSKKFFDDDVLYWKSVDNYFDELLQRLAALTKAINDMSEMAIKELEKYPEFSELVR